MYRIVHTAESPRSRTSGRRHRLLRTLLLLLFIAGMVRPAAPASAAGKVYLSSQSLLLAKGQSCRLKLHNAKQVKWQSSNTKTASVNASGKVKAKKAGTAVITAAYKAKKYTCSVTVSDGKKNSLVVYFSATGTTKRAAGKVQKAAKADIIRLLPKQKYTAKDLDYGDDETRATKEQNTPSARPALATDIRNLSQYQTIYLGYPIWWGQEPRLIRTFLDRYSLKGKTVIPFCTSGSSGISGSMPGIREGAKGASVLNGRDLTGLSQKKVTAWVKKTAPKENTGDENTGDKNTGDKNTGDKNINEENTGMKMKINETEVTVSWEKNASVEALKKLAEKQPLTIQMSMYGGFEQVGPIGSRLPSSDKYTTTAPGDIVLYSGNQIVVFYGANSWDYTRLGKITGLSEDEYKVLLGNGNVTITLSV